MAETTVVYIRDVNRENIDFIKMLKETFCGNFLCLEWENEPKVHVMLNILEGWTDSIKGMFCTLTSDYFVKHRMKFSIFLIKDADIFVCHQDKLDKLIKLLHKKITENMCITAYMRFLLDSLSLKKEKKNKNDNETNISFASKLYKQMLHCKTSSSTKNVISDKSMCNTDSSKELIFCECESSRPHGNNKTCPSHKPKDSPYRINNDTVCLSEIPVDLSLTCMPRCRSIKPCRNNGKNKSCSPRKTRDNQHYTANNIPGNYDLPAVPDGPQESKDRHIICYPAGHSNNFEKPAVPSSSGSENTDHLACPEQCPSQITDENDVRSDIQSRSLVDKPHSYDTPNSNSGNNPVPMDLEVYAHSAISGQPVGHDGTSRNILALDVSQNDLRSQTCISGSSFGLIEHFIGISFDNASASSPDYRLPPPVRVQESGPFHPGLVGGSTSAQPQQYQQQHRETTFTEHARIQAVPQQRNRNDDLLCALGRVQSPEYADLMDHLDTFSRWPSDIVQTPAQVAEAGFYYTGFQDIVRCFVCDGGLKNWDLDDNPWVEHARWFPQCAYVRHVKGEEFINLVRMTDESDEEDNYTVRRGATWGGAENSNTIANSASNEIQEPSVLESEDAQFVIEMGYSKKDVAMAINDIFKKGKQDFMGQEIADIILEKEIRGELSNSNLAADCPPSVGNMSATEQVMSENKHLKELVQCTECKTKQRNILFLPCTHHVVCESCSRDLHICTYCYRKIKEKVRTYMS